MTTYVSMDGVLSDVTLPTRTITVGSTVVMTSEDYEVIICKTVSGATAVSLPPSPVNGQTCRVSDGKGDLAIGSNEITVTDPAGKLINGSSSLVMRAPYQSTQFRFNATADKWNTIT